MNHKEFSSKGGKATAAKLTPEQRSEVARKAAKARWEKTTDMTALDLLDAEMDKRWQQMRRKHPTWNAAYMADQHALIDWYEKKRGRITSQNLYHKTNDGAMKGVEARKKKANQK